MKLGRKLMRQAYYISGSPSQCSPYLYFIYEIKLKGLERKLLCRRGRCVISDRNSGKPVPMTAPEHSLLLPCHEISRALTGIFYLPHIQIPCWGRRPAAKLISDHKLTCPGTSFRVFHLLKRPQSKLLPHLSQRRRRHRGVDEDKPHWKYGV